MAFDEHLADRIRALLGNRRDVSERKMFGGLAFLVGGHMSVGIVGKDVMVRVGKEAFDKAVSAPHVRPMDFTGRPSTGMVYVAPAGVKTAAALRKWVEKGVIQVSALPFRTSAYSARASKPKAVDAGRKTKDRSADRVTVPPTTDARVGRLLRSLKADAHLAPIAREFEARAKTLAAGNKFGSNGLKVNGKLFALFTQGTLVVKLSKPRVRELIEREVGKPFDPGHGRLMKEWLTVTSPKASWVELVREARDFVKTSSR